MTRQRIIHVALIVGLLVIVGGLAGCGSESKSCSCAICVNDVPAYPSSSAEDCAAFAASKSCNSSSYTTSATETCGDDPQPICNVSGCSDDCNTCQ
jgi:hypothetical protein